MRTLRRLFLTLFICGLLFIPVSVANAFSGGSGTEGDPWLISTADQLNEIRNDLDAHYKLNDYIDLSNYENWEPIGNEDNQFSGTLDGNNYKITNLKIETGNNYSGLFGYVKESSTLKNICLENVNIIGTSYVGGLVGWNKGNIQNCNSKGSVRGSNTGGLVGCNQGGMRNCYSAGSVGSGGHVGGLVGWNQGSIQTCYSTANVDCNGSEVGGLIGYNPYATIKDCYSTGSVRGTTKVGGLIGDANPSGNMENCYSTGNVSGNNYVGGLTGTAQAVESCYSTGNVSGNDYVGGIIGYNRARTANCFSIGSVSGKRYVGGLVGYNAETIENSYSTGRVTGESDVGGLIGLQSTYGRTRNSCWNIETSQIRNSADGYAKNTTLMKQKATFEGWNFTTIWNIEENRTYPWLRNLSLPKNSDFGYRAVTSVSLNKSATSLNIGSTETLAATVNPSNATNKNVIWSSNNINVATVSSSGVVTAVAQGSATITVTTEDGGKTATCNVTVNPATVPVTGVTLNKTSTAITVGSTETLIATVNPRNATNKNVTWSSSNTSIATVSSSGVVTAVAQGNTVITVTTEDGGKTATCSVTVNSGAKLEDKFYIYDINKEEATDIQFSKAQISISDIDESGNYTYCGIDMGIFKKPNTGDEWATHYIKRIFTNSLKFEIEDFGDVSRYEYEQVYVIGYRILYRPTGPEINPIVETDWKRVQDSYFVVALGESSIRTIIADDYIKGIKHNQLIKTYGDRDVIQVYGNDEIIVSDPYTPMGTGNLYITDILKGYNTFMNNNNLKYRAEFDVIDFEKIKDIKAILDLNMFNEEGIELQLREVNLLKQNNNGLFEVIKDSGKMTYWGEGRKNRYIVTVGEDDDGNPMIQANDNGRYAIEYTVWLVVNSVEGELPSAIIRNKAEIKVYLGNGVYAIIDPDLPSNKNFIDTRVLRKEVIYR